jgi:hypothetical protein
MCIWSGFSDPANPWRYGSPRASIRDPMSPVYHQFMTLIQSVKSPLDPRSILSRYCLDCRLLQGNATVVLLWCTTSAGSESRLRKTPLDIRLYYGRACWVSYSSDSIGRWIVPRDRLVGLVLSALSCQRVTAILQTGPRAGWTFQLTMCELALAFLTHKALLVDVL